MDDLDAAQVDLHQLQQDLTDIADLLLRAPEGVIVQQLQEQRHANPSAKPQPLGREQGDDEMREQVMKWSPSNVPPLRMRALQLMHAVRDRAELLHERDALLAANERIKVLCVAIAAIITSPYT